MQELNASTGVLKKAIMSYNRQRTHMLLKKKIALSFFISGFIIAMLVAFESVSFIQLRKAITFLEITDTIRSKSLQLRRHEKNFFLYGSTKGDGEAREVHRYLGELNGILRSDVIAGMKGRLSSFQVLTAEYERRFTTIESSLKTLSSELEGLKTTSMKYAQFLPLIELTFLERPRLAASFLVRVFLLPSDHRLVAGLRELDSEIVELRKTGEDILGASKDLDKLERDNAERVIHTSQITMLALFSLFILTGLGTLFYITSDVVKKLGLLTAAVEKTGKGNFAPMSISSGIYNNDEVGTLIKTFNHMEEELAQREKELIQSKKLAAIGTLASGVAHELNNPLNNIYTTSQRLIKKAGDDVPPFITKALNDIFGETMRVKKIVSDLLDFARGRDPHLRPVEAGTLIAGVFRHLGNSIDTGKIKFDLSMHPREVVFEADQEQLEQVFINLFMNAVEAMSGEGEISVRVDEENDIVRIRVSDSGKGMSPETVEKLFEPFFTTKDKGTGLGLAIVFNIVQKHNGHVEVESEEGRGTSFIITLPKKT
jgi:two-component system NtrC family sensor kinase